MTLLEKREREPMNKNAIQGFRDLQVWQSGMNLVVDIYRLTELFPSQERFGLSSQIQRAVVSVPSNIAEGHTRYHLNEYLQHLSIALASLAEVETQVEIAQRLGYISQEQATEPLNQASAPGRQLNALRTSLSKRRQKP